MKKIFEPLTVKGLTLKNRLVVSAMVTALCGADGKATEHFIQYHENKAKGGWGLIIPEDYVIAPGVGGIASLPGLYDDEQIASHQALTERVHRYGAAIVCQIYHAGRRINKAETGLEPVAPSALPFSGSLSPTPRALAIAEITALVEQFAQCALRAKNAGFDGIEIHGAHGYLLQTFVSPFSNKRTDDYGGSLYGRTKFSLDIVKRVRATVGENFLILYRMSATDHLAQGSLNIEESKAFAMMLEDAGVDILHVSQGSDDASVVQPPSCTGKAAYIDNAAEIKKVVKIPVIGVGRINDPFIAEEVLASGKADLVTMARASVADPELPNKARHGQFDRINYCIGCGQGCTLGCTVNPSIRRELQCVLSATETTRKIFVAGAGVAGCETAITAAQRGHQVTLFEKESQLGGQWLAACVPPGKTDFTSFINYLNKEMAVAGVTIKLNCALTREIVLQQRPDAVVIATGGEANIPPIPGIQSEAVVKAQDVLLGKRGFGANVIVIGGGSVGAETADFVAAHGASQVTIVEMKDNIAADADAKPLKYLLQRLKEQDVKQLLKTKVVSIDQHIVRVAQTDGEMDLDAADTIIIAAGVHPYHPLQDALQDYDGQVIAVGDALKIKDGRANAAEGYMLGFRL